VSGYGTVRRMLRWEASFAWRRVVQRVPTVPYEARYTGLQHTGERRYSTVQYEIWRRLDSILSPQGPDDQGSSLQVGPRDP
jgi:predicted phosphoadenosine phosphosulfate sulfurtransferase